MPFLDVINVPVVLTNIDATNEPALQGKFQNSTILQRGKQRIGVIGVLTRDTIVCYIRTVNKRRANCGESVLNVVIFV